VDLEVYVEAREEENLVAYKMDLIVTTPLGNVYRVDVAVATPSALSRSLGVTSRPLAAHGEGAAFVKGFAAEVREEDKRSRARRCLTPQEVDSFVPFVLETSGFFGDSAQGFLDTMEQVFLARSGDEGISLLKKLRSDLFKEIGMVLARGTARIMQATRLKMRVSAPFGHPVAIEASMENPFGDDVGGDLGNEEQWGRGGIPLQGNVAEVLGDAIINFNNVVVVDRGDVEEEIPPAQ
jgi:hypothetical protein